LNGYQELGDKVRLSATLYANDRDLDQIVFSPTTVTDSATSVETRQAGGTLALDWSLTPEWNINVSQTYSQADTKRGDVLMTTTGAVLSRTSSLYQVDMSVTELIADGPLFPTPGGTARLAVGGEHRAEKLEGTRRGSTQIALSRPLSLKRDVDAAFAEVNVPLVGEQNARAGMRRLDAIAAVRYEEYSDFGSTTNPKFGLVYSPVDGFDLRGTYGTSFRAPHLNQFDDSFGVGVLLQTFDTGQIVAAVTQLPSPDLGPENATTWTAGFDVHPQSAPGLAINATYFQIEYEDRIAEIPLTFTPFSNPLSRAAVSMPPDPEILAAYEFLAARDPGTVIQLGVPPGTTLADVQATFDGRRSNTAVTNVSGIDLIVSQSFDVGNHELVAGLNANYLFELTNQITRTSAPVDVVDTLYNPADLRLRSSLTWRHGAWSAAAFLNYVDAYSDLQLEQQPRRVASWTTFDASAAYTPSDRWTVRLAAINVFDKAPPHVIERIASYANAGYDSENANPIGRYVYLMLSLKW
jgi:outer membrane receptor protein involved in Fe transport